MNTMRKAPYIAIAGVVFLIAAGVLLAPPPRFLSLSMEGGGREGVWATDAPFDLQAAIDAAAPAAQLDVPPGVYRDTFVINKPLYLKGLIGPNGERAVLDGGGVDSVLTINAARTTVEGFVIRDSGNVIDHEDGGIVVNKVSDVRIIDNRLEDVLYGIRAVEANRLQLLNNYITGKVLQVARRGDGLRLWQSENCLVEGNTVERTRDAIFWFSDNTTVRDNRFRDSRYGIHMMYTDGMVVENNYLRGNSVGAYLMYSTNVRIQGNTFRDNRGPSGYGLALKDMDGVAVLDNTYIDNRVGLFFDNSPGRVDITQPIERNVLAFNDIGVLMMPAVKRNIFNANTFLDNLEQVGVKGGGSNPGDELGGNGWDGNFWSDYVGYDVAADGVGDLAYHAESLFENLADQHPDLALFHFSPVAEAIDMAARAFPVIKPKPKLTDEVPAVAPFMPDVAPFVEAPTGNLGWLAALLLTSVGLLLWSQRPRTQFDTATQPNQSATAIHTPTEVQPVMNQSPTSASPLLTVSHLRKRYPQPGRAWWSDATIIAVDDLSFEVAPGQAVALWGVNGAGKTTVLKCLLGLLDYAGDLRLNGFDLRKQGRAARRCFGYVPQELAFHNDLSVAESCRFYARLKDVELSRIPAALAQVGLGGQERKAVGALSGGMKQRLALALALLADPPVLLLDEPTSNLDADTRVEFLELLQQLHIAGKTLLFTSHHLEEVAQLATRVLVLRDGKLAADGAPAAVMELLQPRPPRTPLLTVPLSRNGHTAREVDLTIRGSTAPSG
ncbi:MAG: nitrous oxide reductase family maturation protein NosD [Caldilineaceae bacterium]